MKIGILLSGVSYGKNVGEAQVDRDWRQSKDDVKNNIIDCFKDKHDVSVYAVTYPNETLQEMYDFFGMNKIFLLDYKGSHQRTTLMCGLQQLLEEDLDFIIVSRFDIHFFEKISTYNIDYDKFNVLFREVEPWWTNNKFVCDNLFCFPKKYLQALIDSVHDEHTYPVVWNPHFHNVYSRMLFKIGEENIHFLHEGTHNSGHNPFYIVTYFKMGLRQY